MAACHLPSDWRPCREDNDFFLIISFPPRTERLLRCQWHIWRIPFVPFYPRLAPNYSWSAPCMDGFFFFFSCSSSLFHHASALFMLAYRLKQLRLKSVLNKQNKKRPLAEGYGNYITSLFTSDPVTRCERWYTQGVIKKNDISLGV